MFKLPSALTYLVAEFDEMSNKTKNEEILFLFGV